MSRIARIVIPGIPHHVIQRGNRRQSVFFNDDDRRFYLYCLRMCAKPAGIRFWAYCLMDNHVHLIAVPETKESLANGLGEAHRRYTHAVNTREGWSGYLWQGRFKSYPLSQSHLYSAMRYIERNPVRAGIIKNAWDYPWSSAHVHVFNQQHPLLDAHFMINEIESWKAFLSRGDEENAVELIETHSKTGRPLGPL